jgi:hypothetical protein
LEKLGFPWILSSELSIFNGLRWIFAENKFSRFFGRRRPNRGKRRPTILRPEGQDCSSGKINLISDFLQ